jgi:FkbM family methyltransferase
MSADAGLEKTPRHLRRILVVPTPYRRDVVSDSGPYTKAVELGRPTTAVHRNLRRHGLAGWQPDTLAGLLAAMEPAPEGAVLWDVGAHIGVISTMLTTVFRGKKVRAIAFEPTPGTARRTRSIAARNGLPIQVIRRAVSDRLETATLFLSAKAETSNSLNDSFREHSGVVQVKTTTLDEAARTLPAPFVVKIDVESLEHQVLLGGLGMVESTRPWIVCEMLPGSENVELIAVFDRLRALGYDIRPMTPSLPWPLWSGGEAPQLDDTRDWLLAPQTPDDAFFRRVAAWQRAIRECTPDRNLIVRRSELPPDWDADYHDRWLPRWRRRLGRLRRLPGAARRRVTPAS